MPFLPEAYSAPALEAIKQSSLTISSFRDPNPTTISVKVPRSPEWVASRDAFVAEWQKLTDDLLAAEFLEYDDEGCLTPNTVDHKFVRQENPDYDPNYKPSMLTVTIPKAAR